MIRWTKHADWGPMPQIVGKRLPVCPICRKRTKWEVYNKYGPRPPGYKIVCGLCYAEWEAEWECIRNKHRVSYRSDITNANSVWILRKTGKSSQRAETLLNKEIFFSSWKQMAGPFCVSCGMPLSENKKFCPKCDSEKLTPTIQGIIGEWMAYLKLHKMGFRGMSRMEGCDVVCTFNEKHECMIGPTPGFSLKPVHVDSCPRGEKWFKLMMYIKRIDKENLPKRTAKTVRKGLFRGSRIPFDYYAFPKELFMHTTWEECYKAVLLVEVKTGKSKLTYWQKNILEYARSLGINVLILRIDSHDTNQFYELADESVNVESLK